MKDELIRNILNGMSNIVTQDQLDHLRNVLNIELYNLKVEQQETALIVYEQDENAYIANNYLLAKKIEGCSEATIKFYGQTIKRLFDKLNNKSIREIETDDIRYFLGKYQIENKVSKVTIDNIRRNLNGFFNWLEDEHYITKSPARRIHKIKQDKIIKTPYSEEEVEKLRDACEDIRETALIDILLSTGMRIGELEKLKKSDINFHEGKIIVFGKGNKEREVYLNAKAKIHLAEYIMSRADDNPCLFVAKKKPYNGLKKTGFSHVLKGIAERAEVSKVHPHRFRRTSATVALNRGMPIEQVQILLGHVNISTTQLYAITNSRNVKLSHEKYLS